MADHDPLPRWTHGGNGASQAIMNVRGLVLSFREHGVTPHGLQAYDNLRRPATNTVVLTARQYGCEEILKIVDERSPPSFHKLSDVISTAELNTLMLKYKQITGANVQKLNQEPPLF